jgi:hypothetical protein
VSRVDDEMLLERLGAALTVTPAEPTPDEVGAVRALVLEGEGGRIVSFSPARDARHPVRHVLVAAALVVCLVMAGGLVALSAGAPVPSELRAPARALGLPVDSAELADARAATAALRAALARPDDARVAAAAVALETALRRLGAGDLAEIEAEARALLARAAARLGVTAPDAAPVLSDVVTTNPPAPPGEGGGGPGATGLETTGGASAPGAEADGPPPSSAAPPGFEAEAPETEREAPEAQAPEGSGVSID